MWFHQLDLFPHFSYLSVGFFILSMYIGFPYLLLLPVLVLSFGVFLPGPPHVSQCCYSSPNFLCGCFLVLGPLLLLYQLYLHVSPLFCPMAAIPADHFQFLPPVLPVSYIYQYLNCDIFLHKETNISYFVSFKLTMDRLNFILF